MYSDPLAYFLTWTTYGTWLPGDGRGWVGPGSVVMEPDAELEASVRRQLSEEPFSLTLADRAAVTQVIEQHARLRGWTLHAVNVRTAHVHVVVTAAGVKPSEVARQFKEWGTRSLKKLRGTTTRKNWWTTGASNRYVFDEDGLAAVIDYVLNRQNGDE